MKQFVKWFMSKRKHHRHHDFSIQEEADKLGMTINEYEKKVLHKMGKAKLDEIYSQYSEEMEIVEKDKAKFNTEILNSRQRQQDFRELENFMNGLKNYG